MQQMEKSWMVPGQVQDANQVILSPDSRLQGVPAVSSPEGPDLDGWTWLGPGNIGGRVRSIVIHPTNTNSMWAGSVSGGIWHTNDGGLSWQAVNDFMANLAVSTLVMSPTNSNIMYAGTGEYFTSNGIRGEGIFKSTDGGISWSQLASTANTNWHYVNRLAISPDGAVLFAATWSGIFRSTNAGVSWTEVSGSENFWTDIDFHPTDSTKAIAGGYYGQVYYSNNGGQSWSPAAGVNTSTDWRARVEVAYAPSSPSTVYASVNFDSGLIYKSVDGGQSYSVVVDYYYSYLGNQGYYDNIVWVDPTNSNILVVGGIDLWRSLDGGNTLERISYWTNAPASAHADHHAIVAHPGYNGSTNRTVFFGNDGGVYKTTDVWSVGNNPNLTYGWQELNNQLGITQFYGAAGNLASGVIVGGTQDNGTLRYTNNTENWTTTYGGDGGFSAADQTNPNYFYGEYVYLNIHRSTDAGVSASYISGYHWNGADWVWKNAPYLIPDAKNSEALFIAPFVLDPNNSNRLLAGGLSLWRTNDVRTPNTAVTGPSWSSIKPSISSYISAIAVAQGNSDIIWVGHFSENGNGGNIYKTTNGTAANPTWTQVDINPPGLPNRYVSRLTIDPDNHNIVYATFTGFSPDNVWRTIDGGNTWSNISGSGVTALPSAPVRSLMIHPDNPNWLYAGTEVGIFSSTDAGAHWTIPHIGPANVSVDELFWMGSKLVAATFGRGLFQVDLSQSVQAANAWTGDGSLNQKTVFAPGDPIQWVISVQNNTGANAAVQLTYDVRGPNDESIASFQGNVNTPPGPWNWYLSGQVGNLRGRYTFNGSNSFNGQVSQVSTTYDVPGDVLLIDDDDNTPEVRAYYTTALDALNIPYEVWNTTGLDTQEPDSAKLAQYPVAIWFTGSDSSASTGPDDASESLLGSWLDNNSGCLLVSSQEYFYNKGSNVTTFMGTYLGVDSATDDTLHTTVTGLGSPFGSLGSFTLSYPFDNHSDSLNPAGGAGLAFSGDMGNAAVYKATSVYRTTYWGFPFEALPTPETRQSVLQAFIDWCNSVTVYQNHTFLPLVTR
jgi:hypothetical protein